MEAEEQLDLDGTGITALELGVICFWRVHSSVDAARDCRISRWRKISAWLARAGVLDTEVFVCLGTDVSIDTVRGKARAKCRKRTACLAQVWGEGTD